HVVLLGDALGLKLGLLGAFLHVEDLVEAMLREAVRCNFEGAKLDRLARVRLDKGTVRLADHALYLVVRILVLAEDVRGEVLVVDRLSTSASILPSGLVLLV